MKDDDQFDLFAGMERSTRDAIAEDNEPDAFARRTDPDTSHAAVDTFDKQDTNAMERRVLEALIDHPNGLTNHGIVEVTGLSWNTATPRVRPLVKKGLVVDSGDRRMGPAGRYCIVWKAVLPCLDASP